MAICILRDLLYESKDGEWGKGEQEENLVEMLVIRGTDFESVRIGLMTGIPVRFIPTRIANRKALQPYDIIIETAGGSKDRPTGRTLYLRSSVFHKAALPITCASFSRFLRIDAEKAEPEYVFWLLQTMYESRQLVKYHTQHTGVARYQFTTFADNEPLYLPDRSTQRRIASILSAYDDLIENNTRRIAILEEMARRIYEEWFVRFRFPGHEQVQMVESVLGLIPEGWKLSTLDDLSAYINRGLTPKYEDEATGIVINQKCIRNQRLSLEPARHQSKPVPPEKRIRYGDVLINSTGVGTLGRVAQVLSKIENCTVDTHVSIVRPKPGVEPNWFGMALLNLQPFFEQQGVGATGQTELGRGRIAETRLVIAPPEIHAQFGIMVKPLRELARILGIKNTNLRTTRDLLLPKLISGELDVSTLPEPK